MRELWPFTVEEVFTITGRGTAVIGARTGGHIQSGDAALLLSGRRIANVVVEVHSPPGKLSLLLPGVEASDVPEGTVLSGPAKGMCR